VRNELGARREAMLREAMPGGVQGATLVLVVPGHLDFHLEQLKSDAGLQSYLADRAGQLLGAAVTVEFRTNVSGGAPSVTLAPSNDDTDEELPDKDRLMEAPTGGTDPLALLESELGAQVVDES
ncbi:MAG: hypothetical protein OEM97_04380, partial [Acidimicrobiia bacterium]|nr:hypothetical protein [Acidimicrobiia bacterium]